MANEPTIDGNPGADSVRFDGTWERSSRNLNSAAFAGLLGVGVIYFYGQSIVVTIVVLVTAGRETLAGRTTGFFEQLLQLTQVTKNPIRLCLILTQFSLMLLPTLWLVRRWHSSDVRSYIRLKRASAAQIGLAVSTVAFLFPANILVSDFIVSKLGVPPEMIRINEGLFTASSPRELAFIVIAIAVTPAVCEEILFRGYAQRTLERTIGSRSVILVGILFGLYHMQPLGLLTLSGLGLVFGYLYFASRSLLPGMAAHFTNNFLVVLWFYLAKIGVLSSVCVSPTIPPIVALSALPFAALSIYLFKRVSSLRPIKSQGTTPMHSSITCVAAAGLIACCAASSQSRGAGPDSHAVTGTYAIPPAYPAWSHTAVFYQIYPQTFYDSDGDGIGDLEGIIRKLDYVKSLGVDALWINPFFTSPFCDAGYDISDYYKVAPRYGTNEDARRLFHEAHKRGLHVLFDFVASYTSMEHPWFKASAMQEKGKFSNWYIWTDNVWLNPPKAFQGAFIKGLGTRNGQYMQNFYFCEPALNYGFADPDPQQKWELPFNHPDVTAMKEEMKNVFRFWMEMGADGFRADMAGALVKTSGAEGTQQFSTSQEEGTKQFWREIRGILNNEYPEAFIVSEWSYPVSALDGCFHADFFHWFDGYNDLFQKEGWRILNGYSDGHSYFDADGEGDITHFLERYLDQYERTKGKGYISIPLGNHDNARLGNRRSDDDLEIIYAFGLTMPGVPFLYYGNEIGMRQMPESWPQVEGAYRPRNGARTPMQWSKGKNLGFSAAPPAQLYLPVDPSPDAPNVETQEQDPHSLLQRTRALIHLRHSEPALSAYAEFVPLYARKNTYPFIYARAKDNDVVLVILNPAKAAATAEFTLQVPYTRLALLAGKAPGISRDGEKMAVKIEGRSYAIYRLEK